MSNNTIIRFVEAAEQTSGDITRIVGFIPAKHLLPLFKKNILDANPRKPKINRVTAEILDTLAETPELFQFKSKGILIGTSQPKQLQRNRYQLTFGPNGAEGILDGGHNMLSIGLHILDKIMERKEWAKIKDWDTLIENFETYEDEILSIRNELDFHISAELIIPSISEPTTIENFRIASIDICAARNNNAALAQEAKANQKGFYDEMRARLTKKHPDLAARVEWKTNEWESGDRRPIKVRDLVALTWIPLSCLVDSGDLPDGFRFSPKQLYSSKGKLSSLFDQLMESENIANQQQSGKYELQSSAVGSAIELMCDLPKLVDYIISNFPTAYNNNGERRIGGILAVAKRSSQTPYTQQAIEYVIPDGFIMPLVYGLKALMEVKNGKVRWTTDPKEFLDRSLQEIVQAFVMPIEMASKDPQKVGKSDHSYDFALRQYQFSSMNLRGGSYE